MYRPTIYDLAKEAGVSLSTVDRVLNRRSGVRETTIKRVYDAVERIGYVRDVTAANLARQKSHRFVFVLPDAKDAIISNINEAIIEAQTRAAAERIDLNVIYVPAGDPYALVEKLHELEDTNANGVAIMAPETPQVRDAIKHLKENDVNVVAIVSDLPNSERDHFAGIDNIAAGRTAAELMGRFIGEKPSKIMVLTDSMLARDNAERRLGFDQIMEEEFPYLKVLPSIEGRNDDELVAKLTEEIFKKYSDISGVYSLGAGNAGLIKVLQKLEIATTTTIITHELTEQAKKALEYRIYDAVIGQDFGHVVRSAIRMLRSKNEDIAYLPSQEKISIDIFIKENII